MHVLMTSGMAERPMAGPGGPARAELTMLLRYDWPVPGRDGAGPGGDATASWPFQLLSDLARLPHLHGFRLADGDTLPNGDPAEPYAPDTALSCALFAAPLLASDGFEQFDLRGEPVDVLGVILLHPDETQLKLDKGFDALADRLDEAGVSELLEPGRPSTVRKRRWWRG